MSIKFIPKVGVAVGLLAIVLIFLGVNYVPRIYALTLTQRNTSDSVIVTRPDYVDELYPRAIVQQGSSQLNGVDSGRLVRPNYVDERYPRAIAP
jgi:hypothetical protein